VHFFLQRQQETSRDSQGRVISFVIGLWALLA
jgi:hypothetical protein